MKITVHSNTNFVYLETESADDQYILGRIAAKLGQNSFMADKGQRKIDVDFAKILELLSK